MADIAIIEPVQSGTAPLSYNLADRQPLEVLAVHADFDGTGAGGSFKPAVSFYAPDGKKLGTFTADTITAGSTGSVTWFPFAPPSSGGGTTDPLAVHFNTSPQSNTFLEVTTTGGTPGISLATTNDTAFDIAAHGTGTETLNLTTDAGQVFVGSQVITNRMGNGGKFEVQQHGSTDAFVIFDGSDIVFRLPNATSLYVQDHLGASILRVDEGGGGAPGYHIKTGGAWVADL